VGIAFWLRRYLRVFSLAFVIIAAAQLLRGRAIEYALQHALLWAALAAGVFLATRLYRSRRGEHCALCRDTPEPPTV
jgi:hypothetical protein